MGPDPYSLSGAERGPVKPPPAETRGFGVWKPLGSVTLTGRGLTAHTLLCSQCPLFKGSLPGPISCLPNSLRSASLTPSPLVHAALHTESSAPSGHCSHCPLSLLSLDPDLPMPGSGLQRPFLANKSQISRVTSRIVLSLSGSGHYWKLFICLCVVIVVVPLPSPATEREASCQQWPGLLFSAISSVPTAGPGTQ